jgi:RNA polymerase sigma factor (sigma-70 family)
MESADITQQIIRLRPTLRLFTQRFTRNREESQDLIQDTLVKALVNKDRFTTDTNLKGWLFTIMRNVFINNYRRLQRTRTVHDNTKDLYYLNVEDHDTLHSPASRYEYLELWKSIDELKEEFSIPFKMHTSGYKYEEIAEQLQLPLGTVKNRIFQARKEIQKKLKGYSLTSLKAKQ